MVSNSCILNRDAGIGAHAAACALVTCTIRHAARWRCSRQPPPQMGLRPTRKHPQENCDPRRLSLTWDWLCSTFVLLPSRRMRAQRKRWSLRR
jgi:hypothetical protein